MAWGFTFYSLTTTRCSMLNSADVCCCIPVHMPSRNVHECASAPRIQQRKSVAAASSFVTRSVAAFGRRFTVLIEQTHIVQKCKRVFGESCQIQHCHAATVFNNKKVRSHCCLAITCVFGCVCTRTCMHAYMRACVCTSYWQILLPSS